ncbi:uncharacterized protein TNCT_579451 [Trichonephila clavata]|uniref:Uncharacterized protein n=1 Tax=Trichonephila clavata TaxID=2740835 RepID=A0A8X6J7H4_TRICU|nr:uncharacterized protein TNCT_579451 [Trichonephila clavata]
MFVHQQTTFGGSISREAHTPMALLLAYLELSNAHECGDDGVEQSPTHPEPDWLETEVIAGFRVWQILFLVCAGMGTLVIVACCVTRWRIPHTRQEIEANHRRNQITQLFRCHLDRLTVDEVDLLWGECALVLLGSRCDLLIHIYYNNPGEIGISRKSLSIS